MTAFDDSRRLKILGVDEVNELYRRPQFDDADRERYFSLSPVERAAISVWSINSRIHAILHLGYFKARQQFFPLDLNEASADLDFITRAHYPKHQVLKPISKDTLTKQQRAILKLCEYRPFGAVERRLLESKASQLARVSTKPIYMFRELLTMLDNEQIVLPPYSYFQDAIGNVLEQEKLRLITFAQNDIRPMETTLLRVLLAKPKHLYEVTRLKRSPRDFGFHEIKREIARGEQLRDLYHFARQLIPRLGISNEAVKYYASLITYYSVFRLRQLNPWQVDIYLLCFVFHRYQQFQDNLITYLMHQVRDYIEWSKVVAKEQLALYQMTHNHHLQQSGHILRLFTDDSVAPDTPFHQVQAQAFGFVQRPDLALLANDLVGNAQLDETELQWAALESKAFEFKRRLRRVIRNVPFATASVGDPLLTAIAFIKRAALSGRSLNQYSPTTIPTAIIPDTLRRYLYRTGDVGDSQLLVDRYEFFVYRQLLQRLESGDLFCRVSTRYRSLEDDLLTDLQWKRRDVLIAESGLADIQRPIRQHLADLEQQLEERIASVNRRVKDGDNETVIVNEQAKRKRWKLTYAAQPRLMNHPFFDPLPLIDVHTLMHVVHQHTGYLDKFDHLLHRYAAREADIQTLVAAIVAWGTNLSLGRMGEISDLSAAALTGVSDSFIRLETLQSANDAVVNALAALPIFPLYDIGGAVHSSSDGQKFETRLHTFNSRHSPKYFGLQKGVVSYTLVANHIPVRARIIGANEHESHYVFDLLHNNTTDVQPVIHSTDTHGTNEVNFALLSLFGYQFAPRYKDFYGKVQTSLYGFQHPSQYGDFLIKPIRKIQQPLIIDEWPNTQRIILSLAHKTTTQSVLVSKLSSFARRNRTKKALWEYDNIIRSLYLLDYIDSVTLRSNVYQALNRGESYHKLRRAVSYANLGKLRFKTEHDQQVWNECARLITNCVIFYNAMLLSKLIDAKGIGNDVESIAKLKRISPVAWQHVNFMGRYEFSKIPTAINLDALVGQLAAQPLPQEISD